MSEAAPRVYAVVRDPKAAHRTVTPPPEQQAKVEEIVVQTSRYTLSTENIAPQDFLTQDQVQAMPRLDAWTGWLSYTWSQATDRIGNVDVPRSWDQRHAINLGMTWASGPWTATLINSFHSGWPTSTLGVDPQTGDPRIDLSERNRRRYADYNSLDLRLTRTFILSRGALDVFAELSNALSRENPCCVEYEVTRRADGSLNDGREIDSWLPLVPSAGVLWRY